MNYSIDYICNFDQLEWFEKQAMHRKYTLCTLFVSHAIRQYNSLSSDNRIAVIELTGLAEDEEYVDDLNYNKSIVINAFYREILTNEKKASMETQS